MAYGTCAIIRGVAVRILNIEYTDVDFDEHKMYNA